MKYVDTISKQIYYNSEKYIYQTSENIKNGKFKTKRYRISKKCKERKEKSKQKRSKEICENKLIRKEKSQCTLLLLVCDDDRPDVSTKVQPLPTQQYQSQFHE